MQIIVIPNRSHRFKDKEQESKKIKTQELEIPLQSTAYPVQKPGCDGIARKRDAVVFTEAQRCIGVDWNAAMQWC